MPPLRLRIKELGPLRDTEAVFGDVTIIVGKPNTGKSYLLRALYEVLAPGDPRGLASCIAGHEFEELDAAQFLRVEIRAVDAARGLFTARICVNYRRLAEAISRSVKRCFAYALLPGHSIAAEPAGLSLEEALPDAARDAAARTLLEAYDGEPDAAEPGWVCIRSRKLKTPLSATLARWLPGRTPTSVLTAAEKAAEELKVYLRMRLPLWRLVKRCLAYAAKKRVVYAAYGRSIAVQVLLHSVLLSVDRPFEASFERDMLLKILGESSLPFLSLYEAVARGYAGLQRDSETAKKMLEIFSPLLMGGLRAEPGELFYEFNGSSVPIKFASALAAEATALMLAAAGLVEDDAEEYWLLVEEPESQLHPVMHPVAAAVLLRLASEGVRLAVTTHSDLFAATLLELVMAARLGRLQDAARRLGERLGVHTPPLDEKRVRRLDVRVLYTEAAESGYRVKEASLSDALARLPSLSDAVLEVARWSLEQALY